MWIHISFRSVAYGQTEFGNIFLEEFPTPAHLVKANQGQSHKIQISFAIN